MTPLLPCLPSTEDAVDALAPSGGAPAPDGHVLRLDRDHSILAFNERVLDWAVREDVPLLERLRYLCIVSSNLDEFFEVRAAAHLGAAPSKCWRARRRRWWRASTRCTTTR